jgi:hypothetical protein
MMYRAGRGTRSGRGDGEANKTIGALRNTRRQRAPSWDEIAQRCKTDGVDPFGPMRTVGGARRSGKS